MEELEKKTGIMFCRWDYNCPTRDGAKMDAAWTLIRSAGKNYLRTIGTDSSTELTWYKEGGIGVFRGYSASQLPFLVVIHGAKLPPKPNAEHPSLIAGVPPMVGMVLLDIHHTASELPELNECAAAKSMQQLNDLLEIKYPEFQISLAMVYSKKSKDYNFAGIAKQQVIFSVIDGDQATKDYQMHDDNLPTIFTTQAQAESTMRLDINLGTIRLEGEMDIPDTALRAILRKGGILRNGEDERYALLRDLNRQQNKNRFFNQQNGQQATNNPAEPSSCCMLL